VSDVDGVRAANEAFYVAFVRGDLAAMDAVWSRDPQVTCTHPGWDVLRGRDEVMASWAAILGNPGRPRIKASDVHVIVRGDMAMVICHEHVPGARLAATNVFVREGGGWRMLHHHAGMAPEPEAPEPEGPVH
jgi:ketosteroid isomerase-like protein